MNKKKIQKLFNWESNPFTFKILSEYFVGYENEINTLLNGLENGDKFSVLLGPTGSGKTTLLKHLMKKIDKKNIMFLAKPPKEAEDWVTIFKEITKSRFSFLNKDKHVNLYNLSEHVNKKLKGKKYTLLIDECHEASLKSLEWLRTFTDQIENLYIILTGLPVFENILKTNLESFMRRFTIKVQLTNLTKSESREMIKKRIEGMGGDDIKPFTRESMDIIYDKANGFPRETLKVCNELVQKAVDKNISTVDLDFLNDVSTPMPRMSLEKVNNLPERQQFVLDTLSTHGELTPAEVVAKIKLEEYKNKDNAVRSINNLLRRLMQEKLIERKRVGKTYKYTVSASLKTILVNA